jgi:hypothetical protein
LFAARRKAYVLATALMAKGITLDPIGSTSETGKRGATRRVAPSQIWGDRAFRKGKPSASRVGVAEAREAGNSACGGHCRRG